MRDKKARTVQYKPRKEKYKAIGHNYKVKKVQCKDRKGTIVL